MNKKLVIIGCSIVVIVGVITFFALKEDSDKKVDLPQDKVVVQSEEKTEQKKVYKDFIGTWSRTNVPMRERATLHINDQNEDGVIFTLDANNSGNSGYVEGFAVLIDENVACYEVEDEENNYDDTFVYFKINDNNILEVSFEGDYNALGLGNGVFINGDYIKGEVVYTDANILNEVIKTEEIKNEIIRLVGEENYYDIIKTSIELGNHGEYKDGEIFSSFARGFGYGIDLLIESKEKIYCLINDVGKYTFYTNDEEYENIMPAKFNELSNMKDIEINYSDKH